jgi:hypothetical protein
MDCTNVVVLKSRSCLSLMDESLLGLGIASEVGREEFQCNRAFELEVLGFVYHPHAAAAELLEDLVVRNNSADHVEPIRVCMIPTAPRTNGTAAIYGRVGWESNGCA